MQVGLDPDVTIEQERVGIDQAALCQLGVVPSLQKLDAAEHSQP